MKGWEVSSGRAWGDGGPGKCATDYNEKSSLEKKQKTETNMFIHHTVRNTKSFYRYAEQHPRVRSLGKHINS